MPSRDTGPAVLETDEQVQRALQLSFGYLNRREHTIAELRLALARRGVSDETAAAALRILTEDGYLDDSRFALMFVHDKRQLDGWGSERIRRDLAGRGVERGLVEAALARDQDERAGGETELGRALALLRKRMPTPPADRRDRDRALGMLIRRGFDPELALDAVAAHARGAD